MSKISEMIILIESVFWWDYTYNSYFDGLIAGYRKGNYLPLETIGDLVDQYNYVGFSDLCNYPPNKDMTKVRDPSSKDTKGIYAVYYGHTNQNQSGK